MKLYKKLSIESLGFKAIILIIVAHFLIMTNFSFAIYLGNKMQMNDMGNMIQAIYNTTNGRIMEFSNGYIYENPVANRLGGHANLIFFLFVPIYWLVQEPKLLLVMQTALASSAILPLYLLSRSYLGNKSWWSFFGPFLYIINPIVHDSILFDFHALVIAMPLFIWTIYFLLSKRYTPFYLFAFLLAICKEDMPLVVFMMGLYLYWKMGERKKGLIIMGLSLAYFLLMVGLVMPWLRGGQQSLVEMRYGYLANGLEQSFFSWEKVMYIPKILFSTGGVGIFAPHILVLSIPSVLINLLSSNKIMFQVYGFYYPSIIVVTAIVATVVGLAVLKNKKSANWKKIGFTSMFVSIVASYLNSPLPYSRVTTLEEYEVSDHAKKFEVVMKMIPNDSSVSIQNNLGYRLANRRLIITFPYQSDSADYVVVDVTDPYLLPRVEPRQRNFVAAVNMSIEEYERGVKGVFDDDDYGMVYADDGYILFKKGESKINDGRGLEMFEEKIKFLKQRYEKFVTEYGQEG